MERSWPEGIPDGRREFLMKDIFGNNIKTGDIIALGVRSGNVGDLVLRVVVDASNRKVRGLSGGTGKLGEGNTKFVKLEIGQLQNELGYKILDVAYKFRKESKE